MCSICSLKLSVSTREGPEKNSKFNDAVRFHGPARVPISEKHLQYRRFFKNGKIKTLGDFYSTFEYFLETVALLKKSNDMRTNNPEQQQKQMKFLRHIVPTGTMAPRL